MTALWPETWGNLTVLTDLYADQTGLSGECRGPQTQAAGCKGCGLEGRGPAARTHDGRV
jgi:hypothetical protein